MDKNNYDVIIVGSGPGGCIAAKKCAQNGLKTLLLEKHKLPRDKVCTGMIMGPWAKDMIAQEFGDIPLQILSDPFYLKGVMLHVAGTASKTIINTMPIGWRKDIDFWMCQTAMEAGAEVKDGARVISVASNAAGYDVLVQRDGGKETYRARFVIGADGANSVVRKFTFPDVHPKIRPVFRECNDTELTMDKYCFRWFFPNGSPLPRFRVIHKGSFWLLEGERSKRARGRHRKNTQRLWISAESNVNVAG